MASPAAPPLTESKGERTRRLLVEAAVRQFGENGYRQTSIASVARAVRLTPAAVYPYFTTKHELFLAAADHAVAVWIGAADEAAAASATPWLTRLLHLLDHVDQHRLLWRVISEETPELVNESLQLPSASALVADLSADLRAAQRDGLVRADLDADLAANGLETLFLGLLLLRVRAGLEGYRDRLAGLGTLLLGTLNPGATPPVPDGRRRRSSAR